MKMSIYTVEKTVQFNRAGIFIDFHKIDPEVKWSIKYNINFI